MPDLNQRGSSGGLGYHVSGGGFLVSHVIHPPPPPPLCPPSRPLLLFPTHQTYACLRAFAVFALPSARPPSVCCSLCSSLW